MKKLLFLFLFTLSFPALLQAQTVDIIWQGEGYTAPFYQGRTLWSKQSKITFIALPQGLGNPASLDYIWSKNGTVLGNISGVGKNSIAFTDTLFGKPVTIKVEIVRGDEELLAESSVTLSPITPALSVYEDNPLYGYMFHRDVLGTFYMENDEVTFAGFPLFFNGESRNAPGLAYRWRTNAGGTETGSSATYRIPEGSSGASQVSLNLSHNDSFLQTAARNFLVQFENNEQ